MRRGAVDLPAQVERHGDLVSGLELGLEQVAGARAVEVDVPPLKAAIDVDPNVKDIYVVKLFPQEVPRPRSQPARLRRGRDRDHASGHAEHGHQALRVHQLIHRGKLNGGYREIRLHTVEFREPFQALSIINFNREYVKRLIEQGEKDCDAYLERTEKSKAQTQLGR